MRNILFTTTLVAGLILSLSSKADQDALKACLDSNSDKPNKTTVCDMQQLQSAIDARNKDLDDKYKQAKADLQKEQDDLKKKQTTMQPNPSEGSSASTGNTGSSSSSQGSTNAGSSSSDNSGTTNNSKTENSGSTSDSNNPSQPEKPAQQPQSGFGKKPSPTIQWY